MLEAKLLSNTLIINFQVESHKFSKGCQNAGE